MINYFYSWKFNIPFPSLFQSCRKGEYGIKRSSFALSLVHYIKIVIVFQRKTRDSFSTLKTLHSKMNLDCCWKLPPINFDHIWWRIRSLGIFYSVKCHFVRCNLQIKCNLTKFLLRYNAYIMAWVNVRNFSGHRPLLTFFWFQDKPPPHFPRLTSRALLRPSC